MSKEDSEPDLPPPPPPPGPHCNDSRPNGQPGLCLEPQFASGDQMLAGEPDSQDHNMAENSGQ